MPVACSAVFRQRACHFPPCDAVFYLCHRCDRGQRYCRPHCRDKSRRRQRAPLPVNLSHRPDLETLTVANPSLEAYDELTQDPEEEPDPEQ